MRIFLAGGTGIIGRGLIPKLVSAGHDVVATTRRDDKLAELAELGAHGVVVDVYDADRLASAVKNAAPDLILDELTDLSEYDTDANARLRREGTANIVAAARGAGVERMIVQSIAWIFPDIETPAGETPAGETPANEDDPIVAGTAVDEMEQLTRTLPHATVLRYGMLYGPGTWYAPGGRIADAVVAGQVPATEAITSFAHIDDVVAATVDALDWPDGTYHVVDDEPAAGIEWLPVYAEALGAPEPKQEPLPPGGSRGRPISNAKARATGWRPIHPTWRDGFLCA
jgi:nucleoside-diphosphate-sugar epimerase